MPIRPLALAVCSLAGALTSFAASSRQADVVVYGATSGGIAAAVEAARLGKSVILLEPGTHVGGLTTGGLGWTDIGNKLVVGGIAREFYRRVKAKYDDPKAWFAETRDSYFARRRGQNAANEDAMWTFEPKVASQVYREMLAERKIEPVLRARLDLRPGKGVIKRGARIEAIVMENGARYSAKVFIDATYEGDLMAKAGVAYTWGREANAQYGERFNGVQAGHRHSHQFPGGLHVSPYVVPGNPASGVLPGIDPKGPGEEGAGDRRIQAYCFRLCMTNAPANRVTVEKPAGYDEREYELLLRYAESGQYHNPPNKWDPLPNAKTDTNNHGAVSTDYIGMNYDYPEGDYAARERIVRRHEVFHKGYLWTLQNHPRVPEKIREWYRQWGWPRDEFAANRHFPTQIYVREARRMVSEVVMTEHYVTGRELAQDSVGMGAYGMDSHNVQRYITREGYVRNEGNVQVGGFQPYPISYRSIVPRRAEAENLLVPVCLAASHIAYGSIRMEPVFMALGHSAAAAAALAIDGGVAVQAVEYGALRKRLLAEGQVLEAPPDARRPRVETLKLDGVVVDDEKAATTGVWSHSRASQPFLGQGYLHDANARDGRASATLRAEVPAPGEYRVKLIFPKNENRASNVQAVVLCDGRRIEARINQRRDPEWLATCKVQKSVSVTVTNQGTDGFLVVDGLQAVPAR